MARPEKVAVVDEIRTKLGEADAAILTEYRGLTVGELADLRGALRPAATEYKVFKNTLARRAAEEAGLTVLTPMLEGPTAIAFAFEDPGAAARVLVDYAKDHEKLSIKGGVVEGEVVDIAGIQSLAKLPSKLELRGMLAGTLQAPLRKTAGTLYALLGHLRNALEQRQQKLEVP